METERTADSVFGLLSDEIRLDILRTVAIAQHEKQRTGVTELSFSDIYERVAVESTSKFSYHLEELTGTLLRKHETGYAFTHAGEQLIRFVLAENYLPPSEFDPIETDGSCLYCGERALQAKLHDQYFFIRCSECSRPAFSYRVRPAQVRSRDESELVDTVVWEQVGDFLKMRQGVCPECAGRIETTVIDADSDAAPDGAPVSFATSSECQQCLRFLSAPLTHAAAYHPESVAFHWDHGVDIMGTGMWEFHHHLRSGRWNANATDEEASDYRVEFERDTAVLRLYLDSNGAVTRTERVRRSDRSER